MWSQLRLDVRGGLRSMRRQPVFTAVVIATLAIGIGSGLLLRSLSGLLSTDLRFDTTHLVATGITVPYEDAARRVQFQEGLREDLAAVPGVTSVTFTSHMPIVEPWSDPPVWPADHPPVDSSQERTALRRWVMPGFFTTLGIGQLSGRDLLPTDRIGTPNAMVVNDVFAREFFPGEDPLGKRVMVAGGRNPIDCVVVGVVDSARTEFVGRSPGPSVYLSANQQGLRSLRILIRSTLPPPQITDAVRKLVARRNADIPVEPLVSVETMIGDSLVSQRVTAATLTAFSVVALLLAALGLYGVLTHYVAQRTHEIGVRMSLGARSRTIVAHVLTRSAWMVGPGIVIGLAAALAATKLVEDFLYGVPPTDPATFAAVSAGLALVAFAASAWPAWRASRVDPVRALRGE